MPIYEYDCKKCGVLFEQLVLDREKKTTCPQCGSSRTKKRMSVFSHKSDSGFTPSQGGSSCGSCSASSCSGCSC